MLKNKFKIITLFLLISLLITMPIVKAENETTDNVIINEDPEAINNDSEAEQINEDIQNSEDTFKKSDVYLTGDDITIDYIVDGNLFILANSVTINSQIGGDAFILADSVTIGEEGYIFSNLFTTSQNVDIKGVVYDIYALSNNVNISGYVYRDIKVSCNTLNVLGTIGRNAFVDCNNIIFTQSDNSDSQEESSVTSNGSGSIVGDLNYSSNSEISIPENTIHGNVNYSKSIDTSGNVQEKIYSLCSFLAVNIIIWLLCLWLAPKFVKKSSNLHAKELLKIIGIGILTPIVITIVSVILLILGLTSILGLLLLSILFVLIGISTAIFTININNMICNKLKIEKTLGVFGILIITSIVLWLIKLIPYLGSIVSLIVVIIGLGTIVSTFITKVSNKEKNNTNNKENK